MRFNMWHINSGSELISDPPHSVSRRSNPLHISSVQKQMKCYRLAFDTNQRYGNYSLHGAQSFTYICAHKHIPKVLNISWHINDARSNGN